MASAAPVAELVQNPIMFSKADFVPLGDTRSFGWHFANIVALAEKHGLNRRLTAMTLTLKSNLFR